MTRRMTVVMALAAGLAGACGGSAPEAAPAQSSQRTVTESSESGLSFGDALTRAEQRYPNAEAFEVEYERHQGSRVVEVEVIQGDDVREVYFDPSNGQIVHEALETPEADEASALPQLHGDIQAGRVSMRRGLELAMSSHPEADVRAVELQVVDGRTVVSVLVSEPGGARRYLHDAASGQLVSEGAGSLEHDEASE